MNLEPHYRYLLVKAQDNSSGVKEVRLYAAGKLVHTHQEGFRWDFKPGIEYFAEAVDFAGNTARTGVVKY